MNCFLGDDGVRGVKGLLPWGYDDTNTITPAKHPVTILLHQYSPMLPLLFRLTLTDAFDFNALFPHFFKLTERESQNSLIFFPDIFPNNGKKFIIYARSLCKQPMP